MRMRAWIGVGCLACALVLVGRGEAAEEGAAKIKTLQTPAGVTFGLLGAKQPAPAPTLFVFAADVQTTLGNTDYNKSARILVDKGYLAVALDVPCHGKDVRAGESAGLTGWRDRVTKGEHWVSDFTKKASAVLDYLVREGYTDRNRVAACGTSRGGFIALQFAAAEPRVRCVAAFAPVTNLLALREFAGMEKDAATQALSLNHAADALAGRAVWVCIGNNDERVSTDDVIAFTRKLVSASAAHKKAADVELHVMPVIGHSIHPTAHEEAAAWIQAHFAGGK